MLKKLNQLWYAGMQKALKRHTQRVRSLLKTKRGRGRTSSHSPPEKKAEIPGSWSSGSFRLGSASKALRYRLFLPAGENTLPANLPLVVMLHGCEQDAASFAAGTRLNSLAAFKGYAVLYPEQSLASHSRRCWKWYEPATQRGGGDIPIIAGLIEEIVVKHAVDRRRIYVCGLSAGAAMAHILAVTYPTLIAAVGMHSGPIFGACRTAAGAFRVMQHGGARPEASIEETLRQRPSTSLMPAIVISGADDNVVRSINLKQLMIQFFCLNRGASLAPQLPVEKPFGRRTKAGKRQKMVRYDYLQGRKVILRGIEIEGLGHAWSGGDHSFKFNAKGPSASHLMLDFFSRHRRDD